MCSLTCRPLILALALSCFLSTMPAGVSAGTSPVNVAPGKPGATPYWAIGRKDGVGSAYGTASNIWYTLAGGALTEVFYPTTDTPDTASLSFIVTDGATFADRLGSDVPCRTMDPDPRSPYYVVTCAGRRPIYALEATYLSDPLRPTVLAHLHFTQSTATQGRLRLYVRFDPALNANGTGDSGHVAGAALLAHDAHGHYGPVASALIADPPLSGGSTGYAGTVSDPATTLRPHFAAGTRFAAAGPGNIVQGAYVSLRRDGTADLGLGFAPSESAALRTATASLSHPFAATSQAFTTAWHRYAAGLRQPDARFATAERDQYFTAALALKASEDKLHPGAIVASLSTPWGQSVAADQGSGQGYHRVWARDLYELATGLAAAGDPTTARASLRYMLDTLELADGGMPQNSLVDGDPVDGALQLDEVAYPLILAAALGVDDSTTYRDHLRQLADHLVQKGPSTDQERWEEDAGYSPSTIAAEIAGLAAAASIAAKQGDTTRAIVYAAVADDWQRRVKAWTVTSSGSLSRHPYFMRLDDNENPNDGGSVAIAGAVARDERSVVDAGFLELVRLGILPPSDADVTVSLAVVDAQIRANTVYGPAWYRYNHDTYGDTLSGAPWGQSALQGAGHPWPVLGGERGEYELSLGRTAQAGAYLTGMRRYASATGMIPEQIWERAAVPPSPAGTPPSRASIGMTSGQADGSASPLNWALGQYLRLLADIQTGTLLDQPAAARGRYLVHPLGPARLSLTAPSGDVAGSTARSLVVGGRAVPGSRIAILVTSNLGITNYSVPVDRTGAFRQTIALPSIYLTRVNVAAQDSAGRTALVVRRIRQ